MRGRVIAGAFVGLVVAAGILSTSSAGATAVAQAAYPNSIVALGHSGVTGWNSDPKHPQTDARSNSWITGTNPRVNSLYLRIKARNPKIEGHAFNLGVDGSTVDDLVRQAHEAVALKPRPDLVVIETVDNDIRCDGTDKQNYRPFGATLFQALSIVAKSAPRARILVVSSPWATVRRYATMVGKIPGAKLVNEGTGRCDLFTPAGKPAPSRWAYLQNVIQGYYSVLSATCRRIPNCRYDAGALARFPVVAADITSDYNHFSVTGHRKVAALEWSVLKLPRSH